MLYTKFEVIWGERGRGRKKKRGEGGRGREKREGERERMREGGEGEREGMWIPLLITKYLVQCDTKQQQGRKQAGMD